MNRTASEAIFAYHFYKLPLARSSLKAYLYLNIHFAFSKYVFDDDIANTSRGLWKRPMCTNVSGNQRE